MIIRLDGADLVSRGCPFPDSLSPADAADSLAHLLESRDPLERDMWGFNLADAWISAGVLDPVLVDLGQEMVARLGHPEAQARTFAPLVLASILERDILTAPARATAGHPRLVPDDTAERWYEAFTAWYPQERDTRGWVDTLGWLHAVAHGADLVAPLAERLPAQRPALLRTCADRLVAETAHRYEQHEDARMARALTTVLRGSGLTEEQATDWLDAPAAVLANRAPGPSSARVFNVCATLQSFHLALSGSADGDVPHKAAVTDRIVSVLRTHRVFARLV